MYYIKEISLHNFEAWSGGKFTLETLIENGDEYEVELLIEEVFNEKTPTETDINDLLWFETDFIAETLGYEDWETYCRLRKEHKQINL